jgi:hypothetical protein
MVRADVNAGRQVHLDRRGGEAVHKVDRQPGPAGLALRPA